MAKILVVGEGNLQSSFGFVVFDNGAVNAQEAAGEYARGQHVGVDQPSIGGQGFGLGLIPIHLLDGIEGGGRFDQLLLERSMASPLSVSVIGVQGLKFGKEDRADLHCLLRRVRVDVYAMRCFVHDSQRAEHLLGAGGHRALPSQVTQHVHNRGAGHADQPLPRMRILNPASAGSSHSSSDGAHATLPTATGLVRALERHHVM